MKRAESDYISAHVMEAQEEISAICDVYRLEAHDPQSFQASISK